MSFCQVKGRLLGEMQDIDLLSLLVAVMMQCITELEHKVSQLAVGTSNDHGQRFSVE